MKHKRVSNKRIKQILGEIIYDDTTQESRRRGSDQGLVEKKQQSAGRDTSDLNIDSENK